MPYQPTNPYPYNTTLDLDDGLEFRFKADNYDVIDSFKIEIYDLLKNKKLYTAIRCLGDISEDQDGNKIIIKGSQQLLQILDNNEEQIYLNEFTDENSSMLPLKVDRNNLNMGILNLTPYIATMDMIEKKKYYGDSDYENLTLTTAKAFTIDENGVIINYDETQNDTDTKNLVIPYKLPYTDENGVTTNKIVTGIGASVFAPYQEGIDPNNIIKNSFESVTIPSTVYEIGNCAFCLNRSVANNPKYIGCPELKKVNLNYGITKIGDYAFAGNENLESINLLDSISEIGRNAFDMCKKLSSFSIPSDLQEISFACFRQTAISKLIIPKSTIVINNYAFYECPNLSTLEILSGTQQIGMYAFSSCSALKNISLHNGLKSIGKAAFSNTAIETLVIPDSVIEIGESAINCGNLIELTLPFIGNTPTAIENTKESLFGYIFGRSDNPVGNKGKYKIIDTWLNVRMEIINGELEPVSTILRPKFMIPLSLKKVVLTSVSKINPSGFFGWSQLESIEFPEDITKIGEYAFYNCLSLKEIKIGKDVNIIDNYAFSCGYYSSILGEDEPTRADMFKVSFNENSLTQLQIGDGVFENRENVRLNDTQGIILPENVSKIGNGSFYKAFNDNSEFSIQLPYLNWKIKELFQSTTEITKPIIIPTKLISIIINKVKEDQIGDESFNLSDITNKITSIELPSTVTSIGENAFLGIGFKSFTMPFSVENIGNGAFNFSNTCKLYWSSLLDKSSILATKTKSDLFGSSITSCYGNRAVTTKDEKKVIYEIQAGDKAEIETKQIKDANDNVVADFSVIACLFGYENVTAISGSCGEHLIYELNNITETESEEKIELKFTGYGDMWDFSETNLPSWFAKADKITKITYSNSIMSIGDYAFSGLTALTSIQIPITVTSIGDHAFENCASVTSVTISDSIKSIGKAILFGCNAITDIKMPCIYEIQNSFSTLQYLFSDNSDSISSSLKNIEITSGVSMLPQGFLKGKFNQVILPQDEPCPANVLYGCITDYLQVNWDDVNKLQELFAYSRDDTSVTIGSLKIFGKKNNAGFIRYLNSDYGNLVHFKSPYTIDLSDVTGLTSFWSNSGSETEGQEPKKLILPKKWSGLLTNDLIYFQELEFVQGDNITYIREEVFKDIISLKEVNFPNLLRVYDKAFYNCKNLTNGVDFKKLTRIGAYAFFNCYNLSLQKDDFLSCETIGESAFAKCEKLENNNNNLLTLAESVKVINPLAFAGCNLAGVNILNNNIVIYDGAFFGFIGDSIALPFIGKNNTEKDGVEKVCAYIFGQSYYLRGNDSQGNPYSNLYNSKIGYIDVNNNSYYYYYIPNNLKTIQFTNSPIKIPDYAFYNWERTGLVTQFPSSVTTIGTEAYTNSGATGPTYLTSAVQAERAHNLVLTKQSIETEQLVKGSFDFTKVLYLEHQKEFFWDLELYGNKYDVYITDNNTYTEKDSYLPVIYAPNNSGVEKGQQITIEGENTYKIDDIEYFKNSGKAYYRQSKGILSGQLSYYGVANGTLTYYEKTNTYMVDEELKKVLPGVPTNFSIGSKYTSETYAGTISLKNGDVTVVLDKETAYSQFEFGAAIALQNTIITKASLPNEMLSSVKVGTTFTTSADSTIQTVKSISDYFNITFEPGMSNSVSGYTTTQMTLADKDSSLILPNNLTNKQVLIAIDTKGELKIEGKKDEVIKQGVLDESLLSLIKKEQTYFILNNEKFYVKKVDNKNNLIFFENEIGEGYKIENEQERVIDIQLQDTVMLTDDSFDTTNLILTLNYINIYTVESIESYVYNVPKEEGELLFLVTCEEVVNPTNYETNERSLEKSAVLERQSMILTVVTTEDNPTPHLLVERDSYYSIYSNCIKTPAYYFRTLDKQNIDILCNGTVVNTTIDLNSATATFSAISENNVSNFEWKLYEYYIDEYILIDSFSNKYSSNIIYDYHMFKNNTNYKLTLEITTIEGLKVDKSINIKVAFSPDLELENAYVTRDCQRQAIVIDLSEARFRYKDANNEYYTYYICPFSYNTNAEGIYGAVKGLYVVRNVSGDYENSEVIGYVDGFTSRFYDYSFSREETYNYSIIPIFEAPQDPTQLIRGISYKIKPSIRFNSQVICVIGTKTNFNNENDGLCGLNNCYMIDDTEFGRWYFRLNAEDKNVTIVTDKAVYENNQPYASVNTTSRNYKSGSITVLLGDYHKNNDKQWTYKDSIRLQNKFQAFANNGKIKMLRDEIGNVIPVDITLKSFDYLPQAIPTSISVTFEWNQVAPEEKFGVYDYKKSKELDKIYVIPFDSRAEIVNNHLKVYGIYFDNGVREVPSNNILLTGQGVEYDSMTGILTLNDKAPTTEIPVRVNIKDDENISTVFTIPEE